MKMTDAKSSGRRRPYEPTAKDIRRECARIQATWSSRERDRRAGLVPQSTWVPPSVDWSSLTDAISDSQSEALGVNTRADGGW